MEAGPDGDRWFLLGYGGLAAFFALEAALRSRGSASRVDGSLDDRGTTRRIMAAYVLAAVLAPLLRRAPVRLLAPSAGPAGVAFEMTGLGVRIWSMRTLGASYSRTLRTTEDQAVVDRGPYRLIRHPGYLGSLITWTGFALSSRSPVVAAAVAALLVPAYRRRIAAEEELLGRELPGYADYRRRTRKLVPFLW